MGRTLAIGDIHGCSRALDALLEYVAPCPDDVLVPLGDFIDRGPDSKGVIERMIALSNSLNVIPIRGNHEIMMMQALESHESLMEWLAFGGEATLESYGVTSLEDLPASHWRFIKSTMPFHETPSHLLVHARAYAELWMAEDTDHSVFHEIFHLPPPSPCSPQKIMVCGHTPQHDGNPRVSGRIICIDTAVHQSGWLTCLNTDSLEYWQSNEQGLVRRRVLEL